MQTKCKSLRSVAIATLRQLPKYTASVAHPLNLRVLATSSVGSPAGSDRNMCVLGYFCGHYSTTTSPTIDVLRMCKLLFQTVTCPSLLTLTQRSSGGGWKTATTRTVDARCKAARIIFNQYQLCKMFQNSLLRYIPNIKDATPIRYVGIFGNILSFMQYYWK